MEYVYFSPSRTLLILPITHTVYVLQYILLISVDYCQTTNLNQLQSRDTKNTPQPRNQKNLDVCRPSKTIRLVTKHGRPYRRYTVLWPTENHKNNKWQFLTFSRPLIDTYSLATKGNFDQLKWHAPLSWPHTQDQELVTGLATCKIKKKKKNQMKTLLMETLPFYGVRVTRQCSTAN